MNFIQKMKFAFAVQTEARFVCKCGIQTFIIKINCRKEGSNYGCKTGQTRRTRRYPIKAMTIKEMYGCEYIHSEDELFPLQKWYNNVIDKSVEELSIADVLRMIRQDEFIDIAIPKAIDFLMQNPFAGELCEGELFRKIAHFSDALICKYYGALQQIVSDGLAKNEEHDWMTEEERIEFRELLNVFEEILEDDLRNLFSYDRIHS